MPVGKDLTEWVEQGGTPEQLRAMIEQACTQELLPVNDPIPLLPAPEPPFPSTAYETQPGPEELGSTDIVRAPDSRTAVAFLRTDSGNAERFAADHGHEVRFCHNTGKWFIWDGQRWVKDDIGQVYRLAKHTVRRMLAESLEADGDDRPVLVKHALRSESEPRLRALLNLARNERGMPVRVVELDSDPQLLNVSNGTIDLRTGLLREHRREDLITKLVPVQYDPAAACPLWLAFLEEVTGGNQDLLRYMQRAVGYSLTGNTVEHAVFLLYGTGSNGKSTFLESVRYLLGDYAQTAAFTTFMVSRQSSGPRNDLAQLQCARFVTASESEEGSRLAESFVKQVTGGDMVTARFLYGEHFEFRPQFKLWLGTNHKPAVSKEPAQPAEPPDIPFFLLGPAAFARLPFGRAKAPADFAASGREGALWRPERESARSGMARMAGQAKPLVSRGRTYCL
jgi:hypothetical protein